MIDVLEYITRQAKLSLGKYEGKLMELHKEIRSLKAMRTHMSRHWSVSNDVTGEGKIVLAFS